MTTMRRHGPSSASGASRALQRRLTPWSWETPSANLVPKKQSELCGQFSRANSVFLMGVKVKEVFKDSVIQLAHWSGLMPTFRRVFAGRAAILMFHEIQQDCRSELMTGTSVALFEYSLNWLRQEGWEIVSLETCLERLATDSDHAAMRCLLLTTATETMSRPRFQSSSETTPHSWCTFLLAP